MPNQDLTQTPTAVPGLTDGTLYELQNMSSQNMFMEFGASEPDADSKNARAVRALQSADAEKSSGENLYVWNHSGYGYVAITESA